MLRAKTDVNGLCLYKGTNLCTPLHVAAKCNQTSIIALLAKGRGNVNAMLDEFTPLHEAANEGHVDALQALLSLKANRGVQQLSEKDLLECLETLIAARADTQATDSDGRCALHFAARRQDTSLLRLLLGHFTDVDQRDNAGETPLHACADLGKAEAVRLLLEKRASIDSKSKACTFLFASSFVSKVRGCVPFSY